MIINFSLKNWKSFRDKTTFSMAASKERQHGERISRIKKYKARVLPLAAIYGGNTSGKTNFFSALEFVQEFIVHGTQPDAPISVTPFLLDDQISRQPSRFWFDLLINDTVYAFNFAVTRKKVLEEKLLIATSTGKEKLLYERQGRVIDYADSKGKGRDIFLEFVCHATRGNQLFLTNSVLQNMDEFRPIYDWFKSCLTLLGPDSHLSTHEGLLLKGDPVYQEILPQIDLGILRLGSEEIPFDSIRLSEQEKSNILNNLTENMAVSLRSPKDERYTITRRNGEPVAKKVVTHHPKDDGTEAIFEIHQESAGSQWILDLLPFLASLSSPKSRHVLFIDEVGRSLHTLLTQQIFEIYLAHCSANTRSQLILTTHDVQLLDQSLLRRDEIWVAERESNGASSLTSFSEYDDVRNDKDIRKSYLQGRLGGVPLLQ